MRRSVARLVLPLALGLALVTPVAADPGWLPMVTISTAGLAARGAELGAD